MIGFWQCDARCPWLWEGPGQPAARWHAAGEGPAHYFADTPDGAWADFLRQEEIREVADLEHVRRAVWAADLGEEPVARVALPPEASNGPGAGYEACQEAARRLRAAGHRRLEAPSAALLSGGGNGRQVNGVTNAVTVRDGRMLVLFGDPGDLGLQVWPVAAAASPPADVLARVQYYVSR